MSLASHQRWSAERGGENTLTAQRTLLYTSLPARATSVRSEAMLTWGFSICVLLPAIQVSALCVISTDILEILWVRSCCCLTSCNDSTQERKELLCPCPIHTLRSSHTPWFGGKRRHAPFTFSHGGGCRGWCGRQWSLRMLRSASDSGGVLCSRYL